LTQQQGGKALSIQLLAIRQRDMSDNKACKNCKHWETEFRLYTGICETVHDYSAGYGGCRKFLFIGYMSTDIKRTINSLNMNVDREEDKIPIDHEAFCFDYEEYGAGVITKEDFFCKNFEEK
jgi:hypothetical protein